MKRVEPGQMLETPPMKLQQIDLFDAEPVEPLLNAATHDLRFHRTRRGTPFRESDRPAPRVITREQPAGDQFGATIVVGHVERIEALPRVRFERVRGLFGVERRAVLFEIGNLPETADKSARIQYVS